MLALTLGLVIQSTPINVESPGIRLVNLMPKLAAEARLALSVVPALENDVVAIRTMGRPWGEVKANLAKVLNATWEEKDGRYVLAQTPEQQALDLATRYECMKAKIQKLKDDFEPYYAAEAWTDREFSQWYNRATKKLDRETRGAERLGEIVWRRRSDPDGRFIARVLHALSPDQLIQYGPTWESRPFSVLPLTLHNLLRLDTGQMVASLKQESELYEAMPHRPQTSFFTTKERRFSEHFRLKLSEEIEGVPAVSIDLYDAKGVPTDNVYDWGDYSDVSHYEGLKGRSTLSTFAEERFGATVELDTRYYDETSQEEIKQVQKKREQALKLVRELCAQFAKADSEDPLAYMGGDDWRLFSEESQKPLVALLADNSANQVVMKSHPKLPSGLYRADADGWIFGMQRDPYHVRNNRVERRGLAETMAKLASPSEPSRGSLAGIERVIELRSSGWTERLTRCEPIWNLVQSMTDRTRVGSLGTMYSTLSQASRTAFIGGQVLLLSRQPEETRRAFRETVYLQDNLSGIDPRIPSLAFPRIEEGMLLSASVETLQGYKLYDPNLSEAEIADNTSLISYNELACHVASKACDPTARVAFATQTILTLLLHYRNAQRNAPQEQDTYWGDLTLSAEPVMIKDLPPAFKKKLLERARVILDGAGRR